MTPEEAIAKVTDREKVARLMLDQGIATGHGDTIDDLLATLSAEIDDLQAARRALDESVKLQSHYAELLNYYDEGKRLTFASSDEWMAWLRSIGQDGYRYRSPHDDKMRRLIERDNALREQDIIRNVQAQAARARSSG